jgi:hypothetical protein
MSTGVYMSELGIEELADRLLREGYLDNERDARLAAIRIILTIDPSVEDEDEDDDAG